MFYAHVGLYGWHEFNILYARILIAGDRKIASGISAGGNDVTR
jgi:hypothetical protein